MSAYQEFARFSKLRDQLLSELRELRQVDRVALVASQPSLVVEVTRRAFASYDANLLSEIAHTELMMKEIEGSNGI